MKLFEFLNSNLLPRRETSPDMFSKEHYWGLTDTLSLYSHGFNCTTFDKQSKPIIQNIQEMTPEKYQLLEKFKDYEVAGVNVFCSSDTKVHTHIQIEISDAELKKIGLL